MKKIYICMGLLVLLCFSLSGDDFSDRIKLEEEKLRALREKMEKVAKKREELKKSEKNILAILSRIDDELMLTRKLLDGLKNKEEIIIEEIEKTEELIVSLEKERKERGRILGNRLREIYKNGRMHSLEVLLASRTFTDAIKKFEYLTIIAEQDKRIFDDLLTLKKELKKKREFMEKNLNEIKKINIEAEKETESLEHKKKEKQSLLSSIKKQKSAQKELASELRASASKIQSIIAKLEEERKKREAAEGQKNYFEKVVGDIRWPVKGKLISTFGNKINPKYGTSVKNNGIDIKAKPGTPVETVAKGKVVYNDRFLGYGNVVLIDHGKGYYTLYGHLQDVHVQVKDIVEKEQVIGTVGSTGSLEGPKLHFEVRKNGRPVDPLPFLKE
jgi:septal ring factor EnvC (AmiA/AmiB activator)